MRPQIKYTVERYPRGIAIKGPVPIDDLLRVLTGRDAFSRGTEPSPPWYASDFRLAPELRDRLDEVAEAYPEWRGIVDAWEELEALRDDWRACTDMLRELRGDDDA